MKTLEWHGKNELSSKTKENESESESFKRETRYTQSKTHRTKHTNQTLPQNPKTKPIIIPQITGIAVESNLPYNFVFSFIHSNVHL